MEKKNLSKQEKQAKYEAKQKRLAEESLIKKQPKEKVQSTKGYDSAVVEEKWIKYFKENFTASLENNNKEVFSMVIPPPNITGSLHIGHSMTVSIEDALIRYNRLKGKDVLFLPGLDHAGIATQNVVTKMLERENNENFDREYRISRAHEWSDKYGSKILEQFDRLGASLDYSRKMFTLDSRANSAVNKAFIELYNKGLIYRDKKIVNWCGKLGTTLSDLEVNYKDIKGGSKIKVDGSEYEFGIMYYIKYYLIRKNDKETFDVDMKQDNLPFVIVGTTRPETILGDSAICINPNDKRFDNIDYIFDNYQKFNEEISKIRNKKNVNIDKLKKDLNETLKLERSNKYKLDKMSNVNETCETETGLMAINPLTNKLIPVIKDAHADPNLGTGVLKITPSHDNIDFKLGIKHNLEFIRMMDKHNKIDFEGSEYHGMSRFEARKLIVSYHSCVYSQENYDQILPFCSRSNDIVEPMIKEQWWMNCKSMAKKALDAVKNGEIKMYPEEAKSTWYRWLENIKDWCLSRQLWWGHKIPAYYYFNEKNEKVWIVSDNKNEVVKKMEQENGTSLTQDEDVLDTWFSSGLWPFSTLGWGWNDNSQLFKKYFPNSMLETGSDILFFWIARMVMLSYELIGSKPFDKILLHGIVRDAHGKKMSKSLGNVIDPIFVIEGISKEELIKNISINASADEKKRAEMSIIKDYPNGIPKCGSDALRFALLSYANGMKDINLDVLRVAGYSRLCNKLWNAFKFVQSSIEKFNTTELYLNELIIDFKLKRQHVWILNKLNVCIELMDKGYEEYNFMSITQAIHSTFLYDFCDVYIEFCKDRRDYDVKVLSYVFLQIVRLFNPLMPFITEEIHYSLTGKIIKSYPDQFKISSDLNEKLIKEFESVIQLSKLVNKGVKIEIDDLTIFDDIKRLVRKSLHQNINFNSFKFDQSDALVKQMNEIFYKEI